MTARVPAVPGGRPRLAVEGTFDPSVPSDATVPFRPLDTSERIAGFILSSGGR